MKGRDLPAYVHRRKRDGVLLFRKRIGKRIAEVRLETQFPAGDPVPFALHQEVHRILAQPAPVAHGRDITAVIRRYRAHDDYRKLADRTKADYEKHLPYFVEKMGHLQPVNIERPHVLSWRDKWAKDHSPHFANYRTRVLSILMEQARDMGLLKKGDLNPIQGMKSLKYEKKDREPWPVDLVEAYRKAAPAKPLLLFELCLGTGQRIGDVLQMKWGDLTDDGGIMVTQNKTGKKLWVPLTAPLKACLEATKRRSVFILTNKEATGPWAYRSASQAMRKVRKKIGALDYDTHGLRYTAAAELLSAGADDDTIAAVTGQSAAMVRHYTRSTRQKVRALKAKEIRE